MKEYTYEDGRAGKTGEDWTSSTRYTPEELEAMELARSLKKEQRRLKRESRGKLFSGWSLFENMLDAVGGKKEDYDEIEAPLYKAPASGLDNKARWAIDKKRVSDAMDKGTGSDVAEDVGEEKFEYKPVDNVTTTGTPKQDYNNLGDLIWVDTGQKVSEFPDGPSMPELELDEEGSKDRKRPFKSLLEWIKSKKDKDNVLDVVQKVSEGANYQDTLESIQRSAGGQWSDNPSPWGENLFGYASRNFNQDISLPTFNPYIHPYLGTGGLFGDGGIKYK